MKNGTKWNLDCIPDGPVFMSSNFEGDQPRQKWLMTSVGEVNNQMYSTIYSAVSCTQDILGSFADGI